MNTMGKRIYVHYDGEQVNAPKLMGTLDAMTLRGKEVFSFQFDEHWLQDKLARSFDPDLQLFSGRQYVPEGKANFGLFLDSTPDRWGKLLLDKRERLRARSENRAVRALCESDYLLGVFDNSRMGALRFKTDPDGNFLDDDASMATPPWASVRDLEFASLQLEKEDDVQERKWLGMLLRPGSSLGGARPKANVCDESGHLWIAKFPSGKDRKDVGAWEAVCLHLARLSGITVSDWKVERFNRDYHTFLTKRFDRKDDGRRLHYTSAMTQLGYTDGTDAASGASYLELVDWISRNCADVDGNLIELFRRIVFNIAVSNCDDHLRNHGFLLTSKGWTLSPAFDLNPDEYGTGLSLCINENDNALDFNLAREIAPFLGIHNAAADSIIASIRHVVSSWSSLATSYGIPRSEQEVMKGCFSV